MDPGIIALPLFLLPYLALAVVSQPPRKCVRLVVKRKKLEEPVTVPPLCVVTGEPATEAHSLRGFRGDPWSLSYAQLTLPFSEDGWEKYRKSFPLSLYLFKAGLNVLIHIPLFGPYFAIFLWTPFAGQVCGLYALVELLFLRRRQLVRVGKVAIKDGGLRSLDVTVVSREFADEFLRQNTGQTFETYRATSSRRARWKVLLICTTILIVVLIIAAEIVFMKSFNPK